MPGQLCHLILWCEDDREAVRVAEHFLAAAGGSQVFRRPGGARGVVQRMPEKDRSGLVRALTAFTVAGGEPHQDLDVDSYQL
ncbi:hypothetical protein ACFROC_28790 [Nocardia tengchongensis]|uniref:hypothetical protein n=1 Tax=Nocardia tengchongensis TaxID=2055889 RepID=UPI0036AC8EC4